MSEDKVEARKVLDFPAWLGLEMHCQVCEKEIVLSFGDRERVKKCGGEFGHYVTCDNCGTDIHFR